MRRRRLPPRTPEQLRFVKPKGTTSPEFWWLYDRLSAEQRNRINDAKTPEHIAQVWQQVISERLNAGLPVFAIDEQDAGC